VAAISFYPSLQGQAAASPPASAQPLQMASMSGDMVNGDVATLTVGVSL